VTQSVIPKEISWLSFNERVLQEAGDPSVPLFERLKFLGIYSSNMDEFFRVRVADLKRLARTGPNAGKILGYRPGKILKSVQQKVVAQDRAYRRIYRTILRNLEGEGIVITDERKLTATQGALVTTYFRDTVRPWLVPIMIDQVDKFPELRDRAIYLATVLWNRAKPEKRRYALIEIPSSTLPRFLALPPANGKQYVMFLDDVIRYCLKDLFAPLPFNRFTAFTVKITRDAELEIDQDFTDGVIKKVARSLRKRKAGPPVRLVFDARMPRNLLRLLVRELGLRKWDTLLPGGRYHNLKDLMKFPRVGPPRLSAPANGKLPHRDIAATRSLFETVARKDILLHFSYQSFDYVIDLLREASMDPKVTAVRMTIYRAAENSSVINALINASRNGKSVTVVMELQARFDEEANIAWANRLREEGVRVIYGVPGLKVHAKLCLVTRKSNSETVNFAILGTGNFNEQTATIYSDHALFTADPGITGEVAQVFEFFRNNFRTGKYKHLMVSPFNMRKRFLKLIGREIRAARRGKPAFIWIKANNLADPGIIRSLYDASEAGVEIRLIVRSMFSVIPGVAGLSANIEAVSIVDRYLEHSRIFVFGNRGRPRYYLSSADLLERNLDRRVEVSFPIVDPALQRELQRFLEIQWRDNVKARVLDAAFTNRIRKDPDKVRVRAQAEIGAFLKRQLTSGRSQDEAGRR
jgi:polyphosphate kinase